MDLTESRARIDALDAQLLSAFLQRMELSAEVASYKRAHGLAVRDAAREAEKLAQVAAATPEELRPYSAELWKTLFFLSRDYQQRLGAEGEVER